jgi:hypothetical protein
VAVTFRETADSPLAGLLPALLRTGGTRTIRLTGLSRPDIAQWLRRLGTDGDVDELAGRLRARTGGSPLFVRMIVERGASGIDRGLSGFPELRQLALARLARLGGPARKLLDAASVLGERIDPPVLAPVTGLSAAESAPCSTRPWRTASCCPLQTPRDCRSRTLWSGTRCTTNWPRRGGWRCTSRPPARWSGPRAALPPGRSPATGGGPVAWTGRRTACGGPARRLGRRWHHSPTTRPCSSPPSRWTPRLRRTPPTPVFAPS